jgi:hypothetical protein
MKIKILRDNEIELAEYQGGVFRLGTVELDDIRLDIDRDVLQYLEEGPILHITDSVQLNSPFFYSVTYFLARIVISSSQCIGYLELSDDGGVELVETLRVSGDLVQLSDGDRVVISSFQPNNFSFIPGYESSILTSDGLIILSNGSFLANKDGVIDGITSEEVLEQLSLISTDKSPSYSSLTLQPVSVRPEDPREGTLILNQNTGKLEVFMNQSWTQVGVEVENEST